MMVSVMMSSSSPSSAYFSFSSSSTLLPLVIATRRRFLEFLLSQKEFFPMLFRHSRKSSCFWNTPRYPSANTLVSFIFVPPFFSLRLRRLFLSSRLCGQALMGISGNKKGMALDGFHSILRVAIHKSVFVPYSYTHPVETKSAKRLPCLYMVSSDTTYNLKQRMPRFSRKGAGTCRFPRRCGYIGYIQPVPVPRLQVSIKINYGFILTQYLVSCQLEYTIYSISFCCYFHLFKFFSKFFKFLSPPGYLLYRSAFYRGWSFVL